MQARDRLASLLSLRAAPRNLSYLARPRTRLSRCQNRSRILQSQMAVL